MENKIDRLPKAFLERLEKILPADQLASALVTFSLPKPASFRVNLLKIPEEALVEKLARQGFLLEKAPQIPHAFILKDRYLRELQETSSYREGEIYVQSLSSMIPPQVLDPRPGERILDMTAAPGSKTTQMAVLMEGRGQILANDNSRVRFFKMKANIEQQGAPNIELSLRPGESFGRHSPGRFDKVLLDAPCSTEGKFYTAKPSSFAYWSPAKVREMVSKQKRLFFSAVHALRAGGLLVYSTCTFAPEENEGVIDWALEKFGESLSVEPIELSLPNRMDGITDWERGHYAPAVRETCRILPTETMEGFFVAKLRKKREA
ncbi:MAG: RsmB/NOP family class I SAM-dependent RNA methyltransferase [Candidatus Omnitrophota bacterium]